MNDFILIATGKPSEEREKFNVFLNVSTLQGDVMISQRCSSGRESSAK